VIGISRRRTTAETGQTFLPTRLTSGEQAQACSSYLVKLEKQRTASPGNPLGVAERINVRLLSSYFLDRFVLTKEAAQGEFS
jgi:hypothetical protein